MAGFIAQGGCRLLLLEKHFNVVLKERVIRGIHIFLSGVLWCNSGKVQEENTFCDPTEETKEAAWGAFIANFLNLSEKHVDSDLEHLCRTSEM